MATGVWVFLKYWKKHGFVIPPSAGNLAGFVTLAGMQSRKDLALKFLLQVSKDMNSK